MQLTLANALYLILLAQSAFLGFFMLIQRRLFGIGLFFVALAIHMALNIGFENGLFSNLPNLTFTWGLLYPPSLYLYFRELLYRDFKWTHQCLWHYLPWMIMSGFVVGGGELYQWLPVIMPLSILSYLIATAYLVFRFRKIANQQYSADVQSIVRWSMITLAVYSLIIGFDLIRSLIQYFQPSISHWMGPLQSVLLIALVNIMLVKRLTQPKVFAGISEHDLPIQNIKESAKTDDLTELSEKLDTWMASKESYREGGLSLTQVADSLAVHSKKLSSCINQVKGISFSDYINQLRVQAAKKQLTDSSSGQTITQIFYDVGFSSKASFNATFKKFTGQTPSQYRDENS